MTLTFLGQRYESTCNEMAAAEIETMGKYRGNPVKIPAARIVTPAHVCLTYRGVSYSR